MSAGCVPSAIIGMAAIVGAIWFLFAVLPKLVDAQRRRPEDTGRQTWNDSARVDKAAEAIAVDRRRRAPSYTLTAQDRQDLAKLYESPSAPEPPRRRTWA
jgi:hypothetical protein